jgi:hypothetical protein
MALALEAQLGQWSESNAFGRLWLSREAFEPIGEPFLPLHIKGTIGLS